VDPIIAPGRSSGSAGGVDRGARTCGAAIVTSTRSVSGAVPRQLKSCNHIGAGVQVDGDLYVENLGSISIDDRVRIRSISAKSHLVTAPTGTLTIGSDVFIGHGAAIACHESITIGNGAQLGPFVMLMDTDFHEAGQHESAGGTAPIRIGAGARLGARVTVLRGSSIGDGAVVDAGSVVKGDIPAGAHAGGVPARVIQKEHAAGESHTVSMDSVQLVVARTFGLTHAPSAETTKDSILNWDSLGTLNLMLSLEQTFDVSISAEAMQGVQTVGDLLLLLPNTSSEGDEFS
jgi:acyl carrier protein